MQIQILRFFSEISTPFLDTVAEAVTMLGEQYVYIIIITFLYWNVSKREGFKLAAAFMYSAVVNSVLKIAFHKPRPFEKLNFIEGKRVETATGYSFPSGHTQGATVFYITLAQIIRRRWFSVLAIVLSLLVGVSRIYLGVHWPVDVIGGLIFGIIMAYVICTIIDKFYDDRARLRMIFFRMQTVIIVLTAGLFIFDLTYLKGSMKIEDFFKISGLSCGVIYGFFFEGRFTDFSPSDAGWFRKLLRYIIGLAAAIALMAGFEILLPDHYSADFFRYLIIGAWVTFLWPAAGVYLRLFNRESRV
ncbi:MAG: phosphatase PAP2 family protein [Spirochaetales bacterium]|uniref:Phosphatase PAP2 family protein n=1 Tax=Candidatus Thalassospirochaeta sargassi TaxID=3119039 RepID=A0AAJ1MMS8_9SPIO|nr:phosphatase PAP2 family protein [Spirochaetales bacterium]